MAILHCTCHLSLSVCSQRPDRPLGISAAVMNFASHSSLRSKDEECRMYYYPAHISGDSLYFAILIRMSVCWRTSINISFPFAYDYLLMDFHQTWHIYWSCGYFAWQFLTSSDSYIPLPKILNSVLFFSLHF